MTGTSDNSAIIVAIISTCSAVVVALVSSLITYLVAKYNFNTPKTRNILEDQYSKLIVPLHQLIYMDGGTIQYKIDGSVQIVSSKYEYASLKLIEYLQNLLDNPSDNLFNEYAQYINQTLLICRKKLGYDFSQNQQEIIIKPLITKSSNNNPMTPPGGISIPSRSNSALIAENAKLKQRLRTLEKEIRKVKKNTPIAQDDTMEAHG